MLTSLSARKILMSIAIVFILLFFIMGFFFSYLQKESRATKADVDIIPWIFQGRSYHFSHIVDNVYVLEGSPEFTSTNNIGLTVNVGLIVGEHGLIVIDTGASRMAGEKIIELIEQISDKPIIAVLNTAINADHWLGNQAFMDKYPNIKIYTSPSIKENQEQDMGQEMMNRVKNVLGKQSDGMNTTFATHMVDYETTLKINSEEFHIINLTPDDKKHTNIIINHLDSGTVFLGEAGLSNRIPVFEEGFSIYDTIKFLKEIKRLRSDYYIPAHGAINISNIESIIDPYLNYLTILKELVEQGYEKGLADYEIKPMAIKKLKDYQQWNGFEEMIGRNIGRVLLEVEEESISSDN